MTRYIVTANKLNKRSIIPASLPNPANIAGMVFKGFIFEGEEADPADVPNAALGKWFKDTDGFFYWGGAVTPITENTDAKLSADKISMATGAKLSTATKFLPYLLETFDKFTINTPVRQLCFLAQIGHESAGLFYTEELASGKRYEGRTDLGNTHEGDGVKYKGRGLIQITGRGNYQWLTKDFQVDFVTAPTMLGGKNATLCSPDQLKYATLSAGWYWNNHDLNKTVDLIDLQFPIDEGDNLVHFKILTRKINGGYNGLSDRISRCKAGVDSFKQSS
ncbi:glycoside hydrolase family 19 protein [Mucilaginibacter agri]|uniref:Chitinase n=1 Tax=Mucilaginibacter agri TaxID=2695265 RepID=A0A965ZH40_9SPHI|nr:hypothetical protein [Mucilaginibacter agri]NCD70969.1 hypothetical protein [Mucilaginibacter agri]